MTQTMPQGILSLPDEVLQVILSYLSPYQIPSIQLVSRRFASIATEQLLWRQYCISTFQWWHKGHKLQDKLQNPSSTDWRELFANRHRISSDTNSALHGLTESETGRLKQIQKIIGHGYDAKGTLLESFHEARHSSHFLAIRSVDYL